MPAVDELLAELADHPPAPPTPVAQIRARARRRTRRRQVVAGAAAVLVVAAAGFALGAATTGDGDQQVATGGGSTQPSTTSTPTSASSPSSTGPPPSDVPVSTDEPAMVLEPASGLDEGTVVEMAFDVPTSGEALVAQCTAEAEDVPLGSLDIVQWCTAPIQMRAEALEPVTIVRTISTPDGLVDCAEAVGRCTLGARIGGANSTDDRRTPLAFRDDLPSLVEPAAVVDGDEGTVGDGDTLLVTVGGVVAGDVIFVQQCRAEPSTSLSDIVSNPMCDQARAREAVVEDGPETQLTFTAFHDLYVDTDEGEGYLPGWVACEPCEVVVWAADARGPVVRLPLEMEPTETPIRPTMVLDPAGPHTWGEEVDVRVTGLQPSDTVPIGWCPVIAPQGGGGPMCWSDHAELPVDYPVAADGTVVVEDFVLPQPDSFLGIDCAVPGACGVGVDGGDSASILVVVPLDLTG